MFHHNSAFFELNHLFGERTPQQMDLRPPSAIHLNLAVKLRCALAMQPKSTKENLHHYVLSDFLWAELHKRQDHSLTLHCKRPVLSLKNPSRQSLKHGCSSKSFVWLKVTLASGGSLFQWSKRAQSWDRDDSYQRGKIHIHYLHDI